MAKKEKAGAAPTPLWLAKEALAAGDARRARALAEQAAASGPEGEREEARKLVERLKPDAQSIYAAAVVLFLILLAAWLAIFRRR